MTCEIAADFATGDSNLFDLGCSTGTTLAELDKYINHGTRFIGVDNSEERLKKAQIKFDSIKLKRPFDCIPATPEISEIAA